MRGKGRLASVTGGMGGIETAVSRHLCRDGVKVIAGCGPRIGEPEQIDSIVAWLAADESGNATGADFSLNGGPRMS